MLSFQVPEKSGFWAAKEPANRLMTANAATVSLI